MAIKYALNPYRLAPSSYQGRPAVNASSNQNSNSSSSGPPAVTNSSDFQAGTDFQTVDTPGGNTVAVPDFVNFNPSDYFVSLDQAINAGHKEGQFNLDLFNKNFNRSKQYALDTQQTELQGLESFLPRTSNLIRNADAQGNEDILHYSDVFDARNERSFRKASEGNVALRENIAESAFPGTFDAVRGQLSRSQGDVSRVRARESTSFVDDVLKEQAARAARATGADVASSTGFGADSTGGKQIIDNFDIDRRLQIEQAKREDARRGDSAIYGAEGQVSNAITQSENLFNTVIAPGLRDFTPIQPTPRVTDIGGRINPMPSVDAGTLQREFTQQQNAVSMLSPSSVFSGSLETQQYNSGVGLQALGFQQEQNNAVAGAVNTGLNQDKADSVFQQQLDAFHQGLQTRNTSQGIQGTASLITAGLGVLGNLVSGYQADSSPQGQQQKQQSIGGAIASGVAAYGSQFYNAASDFLGSNFGIDIGHFGQQGGSTGGAGGTHGGGGANSGYPGGGAGSGGSGSQSSGSGDIFGNSGTPAGVVVDHFPTGGTSQFGGQSAADHSSNTQAIDNYFNGVTQNDFKPDPLQNPGLGTDTFDASQFNQGFQPSDYNLNSSDTFSFDGGLSSDNGDNSYVNLARVQRSASGVEIIPKKDIVDSFVDPNKRPGVSQQAQAYGLSPSTIQGAYGLYDKWDKMSPSERAGSSAQLLNSMADDMGVIDGAVPGAVINTLRQGADVFQNWDSLSQPQRVEAGSHVVGSIGALGTQMAGAAGPVGMAVTFGAAAFGHAAAVLSGPGINGTRNFAAVTNPLGFTGANQINSMLGNKFNQKDVAHAAMFTDPTGIGVAVAAADSLFGLDLDFTSGKPRTQQFRDNLRSYLKDNNIISSNYNWRMHDGSSFDVGKDGGAKLQNVGTNIDGKTTRNYSDVDFSNPIASQTTAWADVTAVLGFRSPEGKKFTGHLWNAATNADPTNLEQAKDNFKGMAQDLGLNYNKGIKILDAMKNQFKPSEYDALRNSWVTLNLK